MKPDEKKYAEIFALFVEHHEIIALLEPFLGAFYDVGLERRTSAPSNERPFGTKFFHCMIKRVFPTRGMDQWSVGGIGETPLAAVQCAVKDAQVEVAKWGL